MTNTVKASLPVAVLMASAIVLGTAWAQQNAMLPTEHRQGAVSYITGGITMDEAEAFRAAAPRYALHLEFGKQAAPKAEFLSGVLVSVTDARGEKYLDIVSDGPFVLAQLPPGQYTVRAESQGLVKTQSVQITSGVTRHVVMIW